MKVSNTMVISTTKWKSIDVCTYKNIESEMFELRVGNAVCCSRNKIKSDVNYFNNATDSIKNLKGQNCVWIAESHIEYAACTSKWYLISLESFLINLLVRIWNQLCESQVNCKGGLYFSSVTGLVLFFVRYFGILRNTVLRYFIFCRWREIAS